MFSVNGHRFLPIEIGQTILTMLGGDGGYSLSSIARMLGVSHTHVRTLADRAQAATDLAGHAIAAGGWLPPMLNGFHAAKYLTSTGRRVVRVIASFDAADILSPPMFDHGPGLLDLRHMLWELDDSSWLSVGPVNVGYGGTGGTLAFNALDRAGIDETLAHEIVRLRWSDTRVDSGEVAGAQIWPRVPLAPPASLGSFSTRPRTVAARSSSRCVSGGRGRAGCHAAGHRTTRLDWQTRCHDRCDSCDRVSRESLDRIAKRRETPGNRFSRSRRASQGRCAELLGFLAASL